jgi:3-phosphoshikimate 1-carboxyvinyltransferase
MEHLDVGPLKTARGTIKLPGSKSISNRVLLLAALAQGETVVRDLLDSDDTRVMLDALGKLGVSVEGQGENAYRVTGTGGRFPNTSADLFMGNAVR